MDGDTKLLMTVPRDIIDAQVKAAVAIALGKDPEALVRAVVESAMSAKKNSYDRETVWQDEVNKMIREVATEQFRAWLVEQKPAIAKLIRTKLAKDTKDLLDKVTTKMAEGFSNLYLSVTWPDSR